MYFATNKNMWLPESHLIPSSQSFSVFLLLLLPYRGRHTLMLMSKINYLTKLGERKIEREKHTENMDTRRSAAELCELCLFCFHPMMLPLLRYDDPMMLSCGPGSDRDQWRAGARGRPGGRAGGCHLCLIYLQWLRWFDGFVIYSSTAITFGSSLHLYWWVRLC
jgi:hypothetical protein